jgi:hypothetical protein
MCDYSLHVYPNRLATDGEELVVHRFGGASLGLASPSDLCPVIKASSGDPTSKKRWSWTAIKEWFVANRLEGQPDKRTSAVCVPPGARLLLKDIPKGLQRELGVGEVEEVKFVEISAEVNTYRDAVRFKNSKQLRLQALREGQRVTVLSLTPEEVEETLSPTSEPLVNASLKFPRAAADNASTATLFTRNSSISVDAPLLPLVSHRK